MYVIVTTVRLDKKVIQHKYLKSTVVQYAQTLF